MVDEAGCAREWDGRELSSFPICRCKGVETLERARPRRALCMNEYDRNIVSLLSKLFKGIQP